MKAGLQMNQTTHYVQEGQCNHMKEEPSARDGGKLLGIKILVVFKIVILIVIVTALV